MCKYICLSFAMTNTNPTPTEYTKSQQKAVWLSDDLMNDGRHILEMERKHVSLPNTHYLIFTQNLLCTQKLKESFVHHFNIFNRIPIAYVFLELQSFAGVEE